MKCDVLVIGGGIAGLWTLARLRQQGYNALLVEHAALGGVQTVASQGIIHGGTKYALGGRLGDSARLIGDMPQRWQACLAGHGEIDLQAVTLMSESQLIWSTPGAVSRVAGFFAGKLMQDRMQRLPPQQFPAPFDDRAFNGVVYRLNEPVLQVTSLIEALVQPWRQYCLQGRAEIMKTSPLQLHLQHPQEEHSLLLEPAHLVITAGAGNAVLLEQAAALARPGQPLPAMQTRPLHMVMLGAVGLPLINAHCLGATTTPRMTITSYPLGDKTCWYIGGEIAETGVERDPDELCRHTEKEIRAVLPWLKIDGAQWATLPVERAEAATADGHRPASCFVETYGCMTVVWPTKLALAPRVADNVLEQLHAAAVGRDEAGAAAPDLPGWPQPPVARPPWETAQWKQL